MVTENVLIKKEDKLVNYEMMVILNPMLVDDPLEAAINNISSFITGRGGAISEINRWGKRNLAYPIKRSVAGNYVLVKFNLKPGGCTELETMLKISDQVLRHLLIKLEK